VPHIPVPIEPPPPPAINRHQIAEGYQIEFTPVLGGLRHRYRLKKVALASTQAAVSPESNLHFGPLTYFGLP